MDLLVPSDLLPLATPAPLPVELPLDLETPVRRGRSPRRLGLRLLAGFVAFLVLGNLGIFVAMLVAKAAAADSPAVPEVVAAAINNAEIVDEHLWRGGAPTDSGYVALAGEGVATVIDLRAEDDLVVDEGLLSSLGIERIAMPIRDGQTPSPALVAEFLAAVESSEGRVFVHCGAGVGRTGALVAAYLVEEHGASGLGAMRANLEVGPPSLEQLAFAAGLDQGEAAERPNPVITGMSRVLDGPRRIWKQLEG
jgi:protein-tyrosine phosphatase